MRAKGLSWAGPSLLVSASILKQGQNIKNIITSLGSMNPLTSMKTTWVVRKKSKKEESSVRASRKGSLNTLLSKVFTYELLYIESLITFST